MITLNDPVWKTLEGGYKIPYDVAVPLKKLEQATDAKIIDTIWAELWDELHHQGDVGLASYLAVPQLARIAAKNNLYHWNVLGLCTVIEQQRHLANNPALPAEYQEYYKAGLEILKQFVIANINQPTDDTTFRTALSTLAVCAGQIKLSKAIAELEDDVLEEFLEQF